MPKLEVPEDLLKPREDAEEEEERNRQLTVRGPAQARTRLEGSTRLTVARPLREHSPRISVGRTGVRGRGLTLARPEAGKAGVSAT